MIRPQHGWSSLWRHFFDRERTAAELTASMVEWQDRWNWDFLKINPPACYHVLDWGASYEFFPDPLREPKLTVPRIREAADMDAVHSPAEDEGMLGEQLAVIRNLRSHFGAHLPIVQTVFSPIEIAHRLMTGRPMLLEFLRSSPDPLHRLLRKITDVFRSFSLRCLDAGADGIFFATKWASAKHMSWEEYSRFGKPYEMEILQALRKRNAWVILHVCGDHTYLDRMLDYDADVFSYDFYAAGVPSPEAVCGGSGRFVLGGLDPERLQGDPEGALQQLERHAALDRWMAGPSCVVPPGAGDAAIDLFKRRMAQLRS